MNKHLYRIVFNRALGLLQVAAENARSQGTGTSASASTAPSRFLATMSTLYWALAFVLGQAVVVPMASAQIVADPQAPGKQRPTVLEAANGAPLVNIQTPSAAGVSRNTYQQFDVDQKGAILNNSRTNTQTALGGWVQGNPWLAQGTARVILNEVNASNPSQLRGYVEIAGDRAQVVIANPAGISCDGCGFINADRTTLTTGKPMLNGGSLDSYRVQGGSIWVQGKGLDASATNYTALIARSVEVNAGIWSSELRVTAGANEVSNDASNVQQIGAVGAAPAFALDVGALGGMYSQKIVLVGTEHGVGVRNTGAIAAQAGQLLVTAEGRLENSGTMQAKTDVHLHTHDGLVNTGTVSAGRELAVTTPKEVNNSGGTLNARRVAVTALSLQNQQGAIEQTGIQHLALQAAMVSNRDDARIGLAATTNTPPEDGGTSGTDNGVENAGTGGDPPQEGSGNGGEQGGGVTPLADGVLNIAETLNNDGGRIVAGGDIDMVATIVLNNDGGHLAVRQLDVSGQALSNRKGEIHVTDKARIAVEHLQNDAGSMQLAGPVLLSAQDVYNRGGTFAHSAQMATHLQVERLLDNTAGTLASNAQRLSIHARQLVNTDGRITHSGDAGLVITAADAFSGVGGEIATAGAATLHLGQADHRNATLLSNGNLELHAASLHNQGGTISVAADGASRIHIDHQFNNAAGTLAAIRDLTVEAQSLDNQQGGTIASTRGSLDVKSGALSNHDGLLQAEHNVTVNVAGLADNNGGLMVAGEALTVQAQQLLNRTTHYAPSSQPLGLQADQVLLYGNLVDNTDGAILAHKKLNVEGVKAASVLDNTRGIISSGASVAIVTGNVVNASGTLLAEQSLSVVADSASGDGRLLSKGDLTLSVQKQFTNQAEITANGQAVIDTAATLTNQGVIQASALTVRGTHIDNKATGEIKGGRTEVVAHDTLINRGLIDGSQTYLMATTVDNLGTGRIYGDHLGIHAGTLNNREEADRAAVIAARQRLDIGANVVNNREHALLFSAGNGSAALNIGGALDASQNAIGRASLLLNDSATIESMGGLSINVSRLLNRNIHFSTELVQVGGPTQHTYIQPRGNPNKHDISEYVWRRWSRAGLYLHKETGVEVKDWTQYQVTRTEYETHVTESAPATIRSGGNMRLLGDELVNDKSHIIAGGGLQGDLHNLLNEAALGEHVRREVGTSQYTYSRWRGGVKRYHQRVRQRRVAYTPADEVHTINLGVTKVEQHAAGSSSGFTVQEHQTAQLSGETQAGDWVKGDAHPQYITEVAGVGIQGVAIRSTQVDSDVPINSLFRAGPNAAGYLIETDPRFTDYRKWLSSDYMLTQLGYDPTRVHKRLGDGFYEQKLVRDQIGQLTGRRFLEGHANDEEQYRALLEGGATYAQEWDLRPGVALSAAQIAQLTSDIVWLVEQDVTLADGSTARALVPQVYVRVKPGDIDGSGTLLAANTINLDLKGDMLNSGTIAGRTAVQLTSENLRNLEGRITGSTVALTTRHNIDNIGGSIDADNTLLLKAGRDLNVVTTTRSDSKQTGKNDFSRTNIDRVAGLYVTNPQGVLLASAGRDANFIAAQLINAATEGQTTIIAGRDVNLGTVQTAEQETNILNANNYLNQGNTQDVGTTITSTGDTRLQAGRDLTAVAAKVSSDHGAVVAVAQGDVTLAAGEASRNWNEGRQHKHSSFLSSKTSTTRDSLAQTTAVSSTFSGNTVAIQGQNVTVTGGNVVSDTSTVLVAKNDLTIQAATETASESHFKRTDKSGLISGGGFGFSIGKQMQSADQKNVSTHAAASTVGSTEGNVMLVAGNNYQQVGSHVLAPKGDIDIHAQQIDIVEARETGNSSYESKFRQSGITVALTSPVISAIQTGKQMHRASKDTSDTRMKALAAATTGLAAVNAYDAISADPKMGGGVNLSITLGSSKSSSSSTTDYNHAAGSTVAAGGDVHISATGNGQDSDITVRGSTISAGSNAHLKADGDINLLAVENTTQTNRNSSSSSAGVGMAIAVGSAHTGIGVTASASRGKGKGEGRDLTWTNTHVTAGERLTLQSGSDTNLRGAVVGGTQVVADVGGNLNIESLQDSSSFTSDDRNVGGSLTVGAGFAVSASYAKTKVDGDFASVREQSGIQAGDGGFEVRVNGNTDLKGAVIASSALAASEGLNTLVTATLTTSDIDNHSAYKATSVSLSGGGSWGVNDEAGTSDQKPASNVAGKGSEWALQNFGNNASAGASGHSKESGSDNSTTHSGISAGSIVTRDLDAQQALTGMTVDETLARIDRDVLTGDSANGLSKNWDPDKLVAQVRAQAEIAAAFSQQAYSQVDKYVQSERADLQFKLAEAKTPEERAVIEAELQDLKLQERAMNVLIGAVTGAGVSAITKETLSAAASEMRRLMIEDSMKFPGVSDGETTVNNLSGESVGVEGDGKKLGGTRLDLDIICGEDNRRCNMNPDGTLERDENNMVKFNKDEAGMSLAEFLQTDKGKEASGATGGIQGAKGTLFGMEYSPGSLADRVVEAFAGTHDMMGGKWSGLYDEEGNATRDRPQIVSVAQDAWSIVAIAPSTPFAMSEALPPDVWQAISILLKSAR